MLSTGPRQNNKKKENRENRKRRVRVGGRRLSDSWSFHYAMNSNKNFFCIMPFNLKQKSQNKYNFEFLDKETNTPRV